MNLRQWFPVKRALRQGCVMSPWLFNVYMVRVVREVNCMVLRKGLDRTAAPNGGMFEIRQHMI